MRKYLALVALSALVACGSSGGGKATGTTTASVGVTPTTVSSATTATSGSAGKADCTPLKAAAGNLVVPTQLMAQVRDPDSLKAIKDHTIGNLDIDSFLQSVEDLRPLDAYSSSFGSPKAALDAYQQAGTALKQLLQASAPTQADIDAYTADVGSVSMFLGYQTAIASALDAAGC